MSDLGASLTFYIMPREASVSDPLAQESETLGLKFEVNGQQFGALVSQETLATAGLKIVAPYGSEKKRLQIVAEQLVEGAAPPRRL